MDDVFYRTPGDLDDTRLRLQEVADNFAGLDDGYTWNWDETQMHLTIRDPKGNPIATLHVELVQ